MASKCIDCHFFDTHGDDHPTGICRERPPSAGGWPRVAKWDWCGAFVKADKPAATPAVEAQTMAPRRGRPPKAS